MGLKEFFEGVSLAFKDTDERIALALEKIVLILEENFMLCDCGKSYFKRDMGDYCLYHCFKCRSTLTKVKRKYKNCPEVV